MKPFPAAAKYLIQCHAAIEQIVATCIYNMDCYAEEAIRHLCHLQTVVPTLWGRLEDIFSMLCNKTEYFIILGMLGVS
jgi:hypothetical protein